MIDIPDEILEIIFYMLSPYRDLPNVKLVCRRWFEIALAVEYGTQKKFDTCIRVRNARWTYYNRPIAKNSITPRFSHSSCYHDKCLYIFGGCTSTSTTFNDLWKFSLVTNMWTRPVISGIFPSPKAWATFVPHKNNLVLFGGWCPSLPNIFHQAPKFFSELHFYDVAGSNWQPVTTYKPPSGRAGHMTTVVKDTMVVYGGCCALEQCTDEIWVLDMTDLSWSLKETSTVKPLKRYSHGQALIDDTHLLIVGGYGGANRQYNDVWILNMSLSWQWTEIEVLDPINSTPQLWCHPVCKVGNYLVLLGRSNNTNIKVKKIEKKIIKVQPTQRNSPHSSMDVESSNTSTSNNQPSACTNRDSDKQTLDTESSSNGGAMSSPNFQQCGAVADIQQRGNVADVSNGSQCAGNLIETNKEAGKDEDILLSADRYVMDIDNSVADNSYTAQCAGNLFEMNNGVSNDEDILLSADRYSVEIEKSVADNSNGSLCAGNIIQMNNGVSNDDDILLSADRYLVDKSGCASSVNADVRNSSERMLGNADCLSRCAAKNDLFGLVEDPMSTNAILFSELDENLNTLLHSQSTPMATNAAFVSQLDKGIDTVLHGQSTPMSTNAILVSELFKSRDNPLHSQSNPIATNATLVSELDKSRDTTLHYQSTPISTNTTHTSQLDECIDTSLHLQSTPEPSNPILVSQLDESLDTSLHSQFTPMATNPIHVSQLDECIDIPLHSQSTPMTTNPILVSQLDECIHTSLHSQSTPMATNTTHTSQLNECIHTPQHSQSTLEPSNTTHVSRPNENSANTLHSQSSSGSSEVSSAHSRRNQLLCSSTVPGPSMRRPEDGVGAVIGPTVGRPRSMNDRQRQLSMLEKYEEMYRRRAQNPHHSQPPLPQSPLKAAPPHNKTSIFTLDLNRILSDLQVRWLSPILPDLCDDDDTPEELNFYSLVEGRGELLLFGGVASDRHSMQKTPSEMNNVTDSLYFLSFRRHIF